MYRFMEGWFFEPGTISVEEFARRRYCDPGRPLGYWRHFVSWWQQRDNPDVLLLAYENMLRDPRQTVSRIAAFIGISSSTTISSGALYPTRSFEN